MSEQLVGTVTHYYGRPHVAGVKLSGGVKLGDALHIVGHGADFEQRVSSMEINHAHIQAAGPGAEVAIQVEERVHDGDQIFKVVSETL